VPKLAARKLQAAKTRSRLAGCAIGKVRKKEGATAKSGKVVKQNPTPGASLAPGTRIAITLG
jgi:beta-lactam-binding protein with PASTA domain